MSDLQSCSVWQTNGLYLKLINGFQRLCAVGESFFEVLAVGDPELRQPREHFPLFGHQLKRFGVNSVFKHVNCVTEKIMACYKTNQHIMLTAVRANFLCCDFVNSPSKTNLATKKVPRFIVALQETEYTRHVFPLLFDRLIKPACVLMVVCLCFVF